MWAWFFDFPAPREKLFQARRAGRLNNMITVALLVVNVVICSGESIIPSDWIVDFESQPLVIDNGNAGGPFPLNSLGANVFCAPGSFRQRTDSNYVTVAIQRFAKQFFYTHVYVTHYAAPNDPPCGGDSCGQSCYNEIECVLSEKFPGAYLQYAHAVPMNVICLRRIEIPGLIFKHSDPDHDFIGSSSANLSFGRVLSSPTFPHVLSYFNPQFDPFSTGFHVNRVIKVTAKGSPVPNSSNTWPMFAAGSAIAPPIPPPPLTANWAGQSVWLRHSFLNAYINNETEFQQVLDDGWSLKTTVFVVESDTTLERDSPNEFFIFCVFTKVELRTAAAFCEFKVENDPEQKSSDTDSGWQVLTSGSGFETCVATCIGMLRTTSAPTTSPSASPSSAPTASPTPPPPLPPRTASPPTPKPTAEKKPGKPPIVIRESSSGNGSSTWIIGFSVAAALFVAFLLFLTAFYYRRVRAMKKRTSMKRRSGSSRGSLSRISSDRTFLRSRSRSASKFSAPGWSPVGGNNAWWTADNMYSAAPLYGATNQTEDAMYTSAPAHSLYTSAPTGGGQQYYAPV